MELCLALLVDDFSVHRFAEKHGVSQRTVFRDLRFLEERWGVSPQGSIFAGYLGSVLADFAAPFLLGLGERSKAKFGIFSASGVDPAVFKAFLKAFLKKRVLRCQYKAAHKTTQRELEVIELFYKGAWYAWALDRAQRKFKTFSLLKCQACSVSPETCDLDALKGVFTEKMRWSFGVMEGTDPNRVLLEFQPDAYAYVMERSFHWSQASPTKGRVEYQVAVTPELISWVLSFGPKVKVLEPAKLRHQVSCRLKTALSQYEGSASESFQVISIG